MHYDRITLGRMAKEYGFTRDVFEKVCRLAEILDYIDKDVFLSGSLLLKGGTAINLAIFDLPRLSVDIDLDYSKNVLKEEMERERERISGKIRKHMEAEGYLLSNKSKRYHALDSFVFVYKNAGGTSDNIKIEINYMLRCHILPAERKRLNLPWAENEIEINCINSIEIFATKIVALLNRTAVRDLYDISNLQKYDIFDEKEKELLHKCVVFYSAIASEKVPNGFYFENILKITKRQIKTDLLPVLKRHEHFDLDNVQKKTIEYLEELLAMQQNDYEFLACMGRKEYKPSLLFSKTNLDRIEKHPMALWKCR